MPPLFLSRQQPCFTQPPLCRYFLGIVTSGATSTPSRHHYLSPLSENKLLGHLPKVNAASTPRSSWFRLFNCISGHWLWDRVSACVSAHTGVSTWRACLSVRQGSTSGVILKNVNPPSLETVFHWTGAFHLSSASSSPWLSSCVHFSSSGTLYEFWSSASHTLIDCAVSLALCFKFLTQGLG